VLSNLGQHWRVEHFAQSIQRTDLPFPPASVKGGPRWTEHRLRDPVSWVWLVGLAKLGDYPAAYADRLLALLPRRRIRAALREADAVMVTPHYQFGWVRPHTPAGTGIVVDVHSIETDHWPPKKGRWSHRVVEEIRGGERAAYSAADVCFATCDEDMARVRDLGGNDVVLVRNGVDVDHYRPARSEADRLQSRRALGEAEAGCIGLFVGGAGYANRNAIAQIEQQAATYAEHGVRLVVVGRVGIGRPPVRNIRWVGEVDDVAPWLRAADIALCPLLEGSGTSLKSIEYLAAGMPIVSTTVGVRGLGVSDGEHAVVCDVDRMPAEAGRLFADPERMHRLGTSARRLAVDVLSWSAAGQAATTVFDRLAEQRDARLREAQRGRAADTSS